ncbi:hypothetical protein HKX48_002036 [Thoreauomyces humboldtii]|nr:hypothetical protein HKX48_002036 [Thoreauomyces humboldtii]
MKTQDGAKAQEEEATQTPEVGVVTLEWAGLRRKLRFPIPPDLQKIAKYRGYLTMYELLPGSNSKAPGPAPVGKAKRRWIGITDDRLYILKTAESPSATAIIECRLCTVDAQPRSAAGADGVFALVAPPAPPLSRAGSTVDLTVETGSTAEQGTRYFLFVASSAELKLNWVAALVAAGCAGVTSVKSQLPVVQPKVQYGWHEREVPFIQRTVSWDPETEDAPASALMTTNLRFPPNMRSS